MTITAAPAARIFDRTWTADQLGALEPALMEAARNSQHEAGRRAFHRLGLTIDRDRIKTMVNDVLGWYGTYYTQAALADAHLAISYPELLTDRQRELLLAPLVAAEAIEETIILELAAA